MWTVQFPSLSGTRRFLKEARRKVWANARALNAARRDGPDALGARLRELEALSQARVADLLAAFQLARLATRRPKEISVGEAQRVAVARALANGPKVILADEPTAALDAKGTTAVLAAFELARKSYHAALVVATHDADVKGFGATSYRLDAGTLTPVP